MPFGTRGGMMVKHEFPADGEYAIKITPINKGNMGNTNRLRRDPRREAGIPVDGERLKLFDWDNESRAARAVTAERPMFNFRSRPVRTRWCVTFLATNYAPGNDLDEHFLRSTIETGGLPGFKFFPHVGKIRHRSVRSSRRARPIRPAAQKIFVCQPASAARKPPAPSRSSTRWRASFSPSGDRPGHRNADELLSAGPQRRGNFDHGIEMALRRILVDPEFVFRKEAEPANVAAGKTYRISDLELASRLSFFLWSSIPDDELLNLATQNKLHEPAVLEQQVRRMLADPRSDQLVINFAGQWLNLRGLQTQTPVDLAVSRFRRQPAAGHAQRDRAVRRQHRARRSQRHRSAGCQLHLRE